MAARLVDIAAPARAALGTLTPAVARLAANGSLAPRPLSNRMANMWVIKEGMPARQSIGGN